MGICGCGVSGYWAAARNGFVVNNSSPIAIFIGQDSFTSMVFLSDSAALMFTLISDAILVRIALYMRHTPHKFTDLAVQY